MSKLIVSFPAELNLNQKLSLIQKEFKANKSKFNSFGKYNFRSAEDILEALKPYNEKYQVSFVITEVIIKGVEHILIPMIQSTATIYDNNGVNEICATAIVGVDLHQKGMQVPQQFGSASSYAKKYALGNLLLIDDTQDADATNKHNTETKAEDDLKWLNKNTPEFNKAIEYLKNGGNIATIENKYKLAKAVKDELLKVK
jgi:hypothetical protein